mgnify:CR=1 FL=1
MNRLKQYENINAIQQNRIVILKCMQEFLHWYKETNNPDWLSLAKQFGGYSKEADDIIKKLKTL